MKRTTILILLLLLSSTLRTQEYHNRFELSTGSAFSTHDSYNRTHDFSYSPMLWKNLEIGLGINYKEYNLKSETALNNAMPKFFSHSVYISVGYDFFMLPKLTVSPRFTFGYCWQMYVFRNDYYRNSWQAYCPTLGLQIKYWFSNHWGLCLGYSYSMPMLFFGEPQSYYESFYSPQRDFYFNHDLKFGISFRF